MSERAGKGVANGYRDSRVIGRAMKKPRESIEVKTVAVERDGADPQPVVVAHVAYLSGDGRWRHRSDRHGLAGITIRADLVDEVIALLQQAKAEIETTRRESDAALC